MDEAWRELERAWARDPSPETLERVLRAREQAGLPLPARLLRAQRRDPRPLPETIFPIWFIPPGATYAEPCRGRPRQIPAHWVWGLRIEHSPGPGEGPHPSALQTLDALRPPGLELWESNTALLEALPGRGLRYLDLGPRTDWAPPGWRALAQLRELQVLVLASLQAPVTESALTALAGLPRLTALTLKGGRFINVRRLRNRPEFSSKIRWRRWCRSARAAYSIWGAKETAPFVRTNWSS